MGFLLINEAQLIALHPEGYSMEDVANATLQMIKQGNPISDKALKIYDQRDEALNVRRDLLIDPATIEAAAFVRERSH